MCLEFVMGFVLGCVTTMLALFVFKKEKIDEVDDVDEADEPDTETTAPPAPPPAPPPNPLSNLRVVELQAILRI